MKILRRGKAGTEPRQSHTAPGDTLAQGEAAPVAPLALKGMREGWGCGVGVPRWQMGTSPARPVPPGSVCAAGAAAAV